VHKSKTSSTSHASKSPKKDKSTTTTQAESLKAELDLVSPEATYTPGETAFTPVPAAASGDIQDHDLESPASDNTNTENAAQDVESEAVSVLQQQSEKLQPSSLEDSLNKHGKRPRVDDDDDQITLELSHVPKRKRACSLDSYFEPREKSAHIASRSVSVDVSAMPGSSQKSVTVNSVTVNAAFAHTFNGDMIPFGAEGDASQKYQHQNDQRHADRLADFKQQGAEKNIQKRRASSEPLPEWISRAKKPKQTHEESALLDEANLATGESMAEAKILKSEEVLDTPELASSVGDENLRAIDHATPASHFNRAAADEDASATETESATKEGADSKNDEENKSSSNNAKNDSKDEKSMQKGTTKVSKTDSATASTSCPTPKHVAHQDATHIDDKTSQATDNEPAESSTGKTATSTTNQQPTADNRKTKSALKTQDGQKSTKTKASDAPKSTTTSGSATRTGTQQKAVHKSKKQEAQDEDAKAGKKTANNSEQTNTGDKAKTAKKTESLPQKRSKATNDFHDNTNDLNSSKAKESSAKPASSAAGTENASGRVTGTARFVVTPKEKIKKPVKPTRREQSSTQGQQTAVKRVLAETTNTHRLPAQSGPKKILATKKQPETVDEEATAPKSGGGKKRRRGEDDGVKAAEKTAKAPSASSGDSKKRNRDDDEDDAESTKKPVKKQRTNLPPTPQQSGSDDSAWFHPTRASRSKALAAEKAAALLRGPEPKKMVKHEHLSGVGDSDDDESEDDVQPKKKKAKTEAAASTKEDDEKVEKTNGDNAEDNTSSNTSNADEAPATNNPTPAPQKDKNKGVAHRKGEEPKRRCNAPRVLSAAAEEKKKMNSFFKSR